MWKSVWSVCWLWWDHIFNSFLDLKPGDTATGTVLCQTSKFWKNAVMGVLCLDTEPWVEWDELAQPMRHIAFWSWGTKEEFPFFTKCNRFTDLTLCCFTVTVDVWGSMLFEISCEIRMDLSLPKIMCSERWTLKYWDRTECVLSPLPVLLRSLPHVKEGADPKNFHSPNLICCQLDVPSATNHQDWKKKNSTESKVYRSF